MRRPDKDFSCMSLNGNLVPAYLREEWRGEGGEGGGREGVPSPINFKIDLTLISNGPLISFFSLKIEG